MVRSDLAPGRSGANLINKEEQFEALVAQKFALRTLCLSSIRPSPVVMGIIVDQEIVRLLAETDSGSRGTVVATVDKILGKLEKAGLAYRMRIPPSLVGVHPINRNGYGLSPVEVHALGSDIVKLGWSWQACAHAVCVEDEKSVIGRFTEKLTSQPGLAQQKASIVKFGSLSCSHTNAFLNACNEGVPTDVTSLQHIDGRISPSTIGERDPLMKEAFEKGLDWLVIRSSVVDAYPSLPELVQHAKNAPGAIARRESEVQLLLRIQEAIDLSQGSPVDWDSVKSKLLMRHVAHPGGLQSLIDFAKRWGGGVGGRFVHDLRALHQMFVQSERVIPSSTFGALAELKLKCDESAPFLVMAIVKAQGACPQSKVQANVCRYITSSDIASLATKRKDDMLVADSLLSKCHELISTIGDHCTA